MSEELIEVGKDQAISEEAKQEMLEALGEFASKEDAEKAFNLIKKIHNWYLPFVDSKQFENLSYEQKEISEQILIDFTGLTFYRSQTEPEQWDASTLENYCETILPEEKYVEDEDYFKALSPVFFNFFDYLAGTNFLPNSRILSDKSKELDEKFIKAFEIANEYEEDEYEDEEMTSDEAMQEVFEQYLEFADSDSFKKLSEEQQKLSEEIVMNFVDFAYHYGKVILENMSVKDVSDLCINVLPEKAPFLDEAFKALVPVLTVFFTHLGEKEVLDNSQELINRLNKIENKMLEKAFDKSNWEPQKAIMLKAKIAGVDLSNEYEVKDFMEINGEAIFKELGLRMDENSFNPNYYENDDESYENQTIVRTEKKIGRNELCTCGSGKKYKKCCGK